MKQVQVHHDCGNNNNLIKKNLKNKKIIAFIMFYKLINEEILN